MKPVLCFLCVLIACSTAVVSATAQDRSVTAQQAGPKTESLWPGLPPGTTLRGDGDVPQLMITQVRSETPTAAVVILPGGGYNGHAMDHEGYQFAEWFESLGVTSAICTYRLRGKGNGGKDTGTPRQCETRSGRFKRCEREPRN